MDLGVYRRSRLRLWMWMIGPLFLLVLTHSVFTLFHQHQVTATQERHIVMTVLPDAIARLQAATNALGAFPRATGLTGATSGQRRLALNHAAEKHGLSIRSLKIEEGRERETGPGISFVRATFTGRGPLPAIANVMNDLHAPENVTVVESMKLSVSELSASPTYDAQVVLKMGLWSY